MDGLREVLMTTAAIASDEDRARTQRRLDHDRVGRRPTAGPDDLVEDGPVQVHLVVHRDKRHGIGREGVSGTEISHVDLATTDERPVRAVQVVDTEPVRAPLQQTLGG